jgi:hypothetical protein
MTDSQYTQALRIVEEFNNKYIKPIEYAYLDGYAPETGGLMETDLLEKQNISNFTVKYNRGIKSLSSIGIIKLIEEGSADPCSRCWATKTLATIEVATTCILSRVGDVVSAIYIPEDIHRFKFHVRDFQTNNKVVGEYDEYAIDGQTLRQLLNEEKALCITMGTNVRVAMFKELEYERMHNYHQSKIRIRLSEKLSIGGQEYKRIELGYPFLPLISLQYAEVALEFFEKCTIRVEYVYLDTKPRMALSKCQVSAIHPFVGRSDPVVEGAIPILLPGITSEIWLGQLRVLD